MIWQKISWGKAWLNFYCVIEVLSSPTERCIEELRQPLEAVGAGIMRRTMDRDERSREEKQGLGHVFSFGSIKLLNGLSYF